MHPCSPCCHCEYDYEPTPSGEPSEYICRDCGGAFFDIDHAHTERELDRIVLDLQKFNTPNLMKKYLRENVLNIYNYEFDEEDDD